MLKDKTVRKQGWFSLRRIEQYVSLFRLFVMKLLCKVLHDLQPLQVQVVLLSLEVAQVAVILPLSTGSAAECAVCVWNNSGNYPAEQRLLQL